MTYSSFIKILIVIYTLDRFRGAFSSTYNFYVTSHGNSIKPKNSKLIQKNLKLDGSISHDIFKLHKNFETVTHLI